MLTSKPLREYAPNFKEVTFIGSFEKHPPVMFLWTFKLKVLVWNLSVLISPFKPLPPPHLPLPLFPFEWIIYYSCLSFSRGVSTSTRFEVEKFNRSEVKKLRWGNSIWVHLFWMDIVFLGTCTAGIHAGVKWALTQGCVTWTAATEPVEEDHNI